MEKYITENGIKYELKGEQYYPILGETKATEHHIGKYGLLHRDYIKQHKREIYTTLLTEGKLNAHLHECWSEYASLAEAAIFEYAFKPGMQIAIETLTE